MREGAGIPPDFHAILPAIQYIEEHPSENTTVPELAAMCFLSESYFRARFRAFAGCSPTDYRNRLRVGKAKELLQSSLWTTDLIAEALGFYDTSHFYRVYKRVTGQTPRGE
jgi:AraC-like DNA-binding protein